MVPLEASYPGVYIDTFIFFLRSLCKIIWMNVHYFPNAPRILLVPVGPLLDTQMNSTSMVQIVTTYIYANLTTIWLWHSHTSDILILAWPAQSKLRTLCEKVKPHLHCNRKCRITNRGKISGNILWQRSLHVQTPPKLRILGKFRPRFIFALFAL